MTVSLLSTSADVASDPRGDWLLLRRCRLVFLLGLAASVLLLGVSGVVRSRAGGPVSIAGPTMHAAYVLLFVVGFLSLLRGRPGRLRVESTALAILGAILLTLAVDAASQGTLFPPTLLVTLVLIAASALLPWRVGFQVALVAIALAAYPASRLVFARDTVAPGVWFWPVDHPDPRASSVLGATAIALIGLVSVIVTWSLYRLRRRALRAEEVGGYRLVDRLGEGGMGTVYRAEHDRMCRSSAVKVVTVGPEMGPLIIERFQREIQLASRLDHPHTIEIRDFGRCDDSTFFYAMEYLVGLDLRQLVRRFGPLPAERTIHVLIQVCDSLSEAHGLGIVHRDLKPANVFLTRRGGISDFVKVLDFGLAKEVGGAELTRTGVVLGTPHFMPPEAVYGADNYEPRSDLYSLGCTAYWMLAGRPPFGGESSPEVMAAHVREPPPPVDRHSELPVPAELTEAVSRCLAKRVEERFETATHLRDRLAAIDVAHPWTAERAHEWWELHMTAEPGVGETSSEQVRE
jgi:hypothetical protein